MSQPSNPTPQAWGDRYRAVQPTYDAFAFKMKGLVDDLLAGRSIDVVQTEARGKTLDSFVGKVRRKGKHYQNPLTDITDLAGIRVIAYYLEDAAAAAEMIEAEFEVDRERSVQKADQFDPDRFGYLSDHFVVRLKAPRAELAEWQAFDDLVVEIQIRTATQHAWAAVEHRLGYKSAKQLPSDLRRRLNRLSALFELADEQFSGVRRAADAIAEGYSESLRGHDLELPLDVTSLAVYLQQSPIVKAIVEALTAAGASVEEKETDNRRDRDRSDLLKVLSNHSISTVAELDKELRGWEHARKSLTRFIALHKDLDGTKEYEIFVEDALTLLLFLLWKSPTDEFRTIYAGDTVAIFSKATEPA